MDNKATYGGKREHSGRKPSPYPRKLKELRPDDDQAWREFLIMLTGDARKDFLLIQAALNYYKKHESDP